MAPEDFRAWLPTVVMLGGLVVNGLWVIYRKGGERQLRENEKTENGAAHTTLDGKIRLVSADLVDVRKSAVRAHERIDAHAVKLGMLESNGQSLKDRMDSGFAEVNANLRELRGEIVNALKKG